MALLTNNAEGGSDGTSVTLGNSGGTSGTAFSTVSGGSGGSITYSAADAYRGNLSYAFTQPTGSIGCLVDIDDAAPSGSFTARFYINLLSLPSVTNAPFPVAIRALSGAIGNVEMSDAGQLRVSMGGGFSGYSTGTIATNTWYRIEYYGSGIGTSASTATVDAYVGDTNGTPVATSTLSGQTTALQVQRIRYGKISGTPAAVVNWRMDDIAQNVGSSTPLGPSTVSGGDAGPDQTVEPWSTITLTGTGTGVWSQTSGPAVTLSGSGNTRTFTAPGTVSGATYTFSFGGDTVQITSMPATERLVIGGQEVAVLTTTVSSG